MSRRRTGAKAAGKLSPRSAGVESRGEPRGGARIVGIDALRGIALCLMFGYHFAFDLRWFRVTQADFEGDPFWLGLRALIVTLFLGLVGVSLVLADRAGATREHFWRRFGMVAACAFAASVGSWVTFPARYIYFGILHCIAVASVLSLPMVRRPRAALVLGAAVLIAGLTFADPAFDGRALSWIGFVTHKPATDDYVPLFPWSGIVFVGIAVGHALTRTSFRALASLAGAPNWLRFIGRHSLVVYMVHQPILLGLLWVLLK